MISLPEAQKQPRKEPPHKEACAHLDRVGKKKEKGRSFLNPWC